MSRQGILFLNITIIEKYAKYITDCNKKSLRDSFSGPVRNDPNNLLALRQSVL